MMNIMNGGKHADSSLSVQEFMPEIKLASLGNDAGIIGSVIDLK